MGLYDFVAGFEVGLYRVGEPADSMAVSYTSKSAAKMPTAAQCDK